VEEELGGEARYARFWSAHESAIGRRQALRTGAEQVERIAAEIRLQSQAEVGLEDVARPDVIYAAGHGGAVALSCGIRVESPDPVCVPCRRLRLQAGTEKIKPEVEGSSPLRRPKRFEPPLIAGQLVAQQVVVVGERECGDGHGSRRRLGELLDEPAELIAEVTEPPSAHGPLCSALHERQPAHRRKGIV
jgi:hypothetical protein